MKTLSLTLVLTQLLFVVLGASWALAGLPPPQQGCGITIVKVAPGAGDTDFFPFEVIVDGNEPSSFTLLDGESTGGPFNSSVSVTELPLEGGWVLRNVECEGDSGISFRIEDDGFRAVCNSDGSFATCTFFNEQASNIPTLSEWGMLVAGAGLGLIGLFYVIRRKRATAKI